MTTRPWIIRRTVFRKSCRLTNNFPRTPKEPTCS